MSCVIFVMPLYYRLLTYERLTDRIVNGVWCVLCPAVGHKLSRYVHVS